MAVLSNWFQFHAVTTAPETMAGRGLPLRARPEPEVFGGGAPSTHVSPVGMHGPFGGEMEGGQHDFGANINPAFRHMAGTTQPPELPTVPGSSGRIVKSYTPGAAPSYAPPSEAAIYNKLQANAPVGIPASKWSPTQLFTGVRTPSQWLQDVYVPGGGNAAGAAAALQQNYQTPTNPYTQGTSWIQDAINAIFGPPK